MHMKYCPNRDCPYAVRHREPGEYRDEATACTDCGAELVAELPSWVRPAPATEGTLAIRLAWTVLAPALVVGLANRLILPGLDRDLIESFLGEFASTVNVSPFALGLTPMISAFLFVELAAALVPSWRPLRHGGPAGRGRLLVATTWLAFAFVSFQALNMAVYLRKTDVLERSSGFSALLVVLTLVGGTFALVALAPLLDRVALGGGYSLLVTGLQAASALPPLLALSTRPRSLVILVAVAAGSVLFLRWRPVGALPLPVCGLVPLQWGGGLVAAGLSLAGSGIGPRWVRWLGEQPAPAALALALAVTAGLAVGLGFLFNLPSKVAAFGADARPRVERAVVFSTGFVLAVALVSGLIWEEVTVADTLSLIPLIAAVALVLDVIDEAQAVRRHGTLVAVWPEHRLYAVGSALEALERQGIPGLARSAHQRALWHFFAPYIPVQILVPRERAQEAAALLHEHFLGAAPLVA
jgi:hypothetical protein